MAQKQHKFSFKKLALTAAGGLASLAAFTFVTAGSASAWYNNGNWNNYNDHCNHYSWNNGHRHCWHWQWDGNQWCRHYDY